jgi:hypothetical protein
MNSNSAAVQLQEDALAANGQAHAATKRDRDDAGASGAGRNVRRQIAQDHDSDEDGYEGGDEEGAMSGSPAPQDAAARLARWNRRGTSRRESQRVGSGRYEFGQPPAAAPGSTEIPGKLPVTISGMNRQRIAQTNRANYGDETLGSIPKYSGMQQHLNYPGATKALFEPGFAPPGGLTQRQKMATGLAATASNVSEPDKAGGADKLIRALARRHDANPGAPHPLDPAVNPMVRSAPYGRSVMSGETELNEHQIAAIDGYASESSDEDAAPWPIRTGMLVKTADLAPRRRGNVRR